MSKAAALAALSVLWLARPAAACSQGESEDKVREAIYAMSDLAPSDPARAAAAQKKIDAAIDEAMKPSKNMEEMQASTDRLCREMDDVLSDLRTPAPAR